MQRYQKNINFKIRQARIKDARFLYKIYNKNILLNNFFSTKQIKFREHLIWLRNCLENKSIYIIYKIHPIGYVRFENLKSNIFYISIAINGKYKKKGIAKKALFKAIKKIKLSKLKLIASIKKSNKRSQKFFTSCGFKKIRNSTEYILDYKNE